MRAVILGIGNILLKDEGVGVHAVRAIDREFSLPDNVEIVDGGTMGLDLLPFIENRDMVLIVDAADFKKKAGTIKTIEGPDIPAFLSTKFSVHQIGLPDMIFAAGLMGIRPRQMCLVGIQPKEIDAGLELSEELGERFGELLDTICARLKKWGVELTRKDNVPCNTI
ncbi:MAG: HyaD/HybD family hydrogenase maturation endopeptidase [Nitrospirae bacterium]|nr:HyaD/HybD family hydrogenase maturation endopeptidase [Nitrospirota bacterium]